MSFLHLKRHGVVRILDFFRLADVGMFLSSSAVLRWDYGDYFCDVFRATFGTFVLHKMPQYNDDFGGYFQDCFFRFFETKRSATVQFVLVAFGVFCLADVVFVLTWNAMER